MKLKKTRKKLYTVLIAVLAVSLLAVIGAEIAVIAQRSKNRALAELPSVTASPEPTSTPTPAPTPTPEPTPSPTPAPEGREIYITATSSEEDLYAVVRYADGAPVKGYNFSLVFTHPDGSTESWKTDTDGTCYLVRMESGEYTVSANELEGFITPEPVQCTVKERVAREVIENITQVVEVKEVTELSTSEVKTVNYEAATGDEQPEIILTEEVQEAAEQVAAAEEVQSVASNGEGLYTYTYELGQNSCLLREDGTESDLHPVLIGQLLYGIREYVDEFGEPMSEEVSLLNADNTPISGYQITATPVTEEAVIKTGWQTENGNTYYYDAYGNRLTGLKNIDGKLYFFSPDGVKASSVGIDVSYFNGSIDWNAVKASGVDFAIIRIGGRGWGESGTLYNDDNFYANINGAKYAGISVGAYFYSSAISVEEAIEEASLAVEKLGGIGLDYPLYIDMEYSNDYPNGRADLLSAEQHTAIVQAFCDTVRSSGYRAGVYSGQYYYSTALNIDALTSYSIWLANYTEGYALPGYSGYYRMWQCTDKGRVGGIRGNVDLNIVF